MPIKWDPIKVTDATDMLEGFLEEAREPLEKALLVAQEARNIENLPQYVGQYFINLAYSIEGCLGGTRFNQPFDGWFRGSIKRIREAIPEKALETERDRQSRGVQQALV
ncbi:MAG: hypothetical protein AABZ77_09440 [Chloroflexota bacterium]